MVNIVTGEGMGLRDGSWSTVGGKHVGPNDVFGSNGESGTVNLYNGNLIIQDQDALFKSLGLDSSVLRVYNSQSTKPWQFGVEKELEGLTGQVNTAGSSITRVGADGHKTVYNYDITSGCYVSSGSVKDTLTVKGDTWIWVSHDESISETYINNQLVESRDANGNVTKYEYSGKDLVSITDASGQTVRFTRVDNTLTISVEKDGKTESAVTYVYDAKQRLEQVKVDLNGDGKNIYITSYTYDGDSNRIASITHSDGTKIAFTYIESNGVYKVETMTDGLGRKISFEYFDGKTIVTDANGQKTTYEYNDKGQITRIIYPAVNGKQSTITYKYNDAGLLESITDNHGNTTSFKYDANGNCIREENAAGDVIERVYDEHNHLISQKVILNKDSGKVAESHNIYDEHGNTRFHVTADGRVVEYEYDENGNLKAEHHYSKDNYEGAFDLTSLEAWAKSQTAQSLTEYEYDFRGQISKVITYPNSTDKSNKTEVHYIYDAHGNLLQKKVFDADGKEYTSSYTYDAFGRVLTETDSLGHSTKHDYNAQTHTSTITFENGLVETYEYDDAGNLISKTATDSKHENRLISESSYVYDDNGNLVAESSNGITKYYFYNELNQKVAEVDGNGNFTSYTYNDLGQLVATRQSANTVNTKSWLDGILALADILPQESADDRTGHIVYDKAGRVHYKIDAQGYVTEYFYNGRGDLIKETAYANKLENIPLSLDENVRLEIKKSADDRSVDVFYDLDGNKTGQLDAAGYYTQFSYDAAGNLIQTTRFAEKQTTQAIKENNLKTSDNDATTQLIYNDKGQVTGQIDAEGYYTETKYDSFGNVASTTRYATKTTDGNKPASNDKDQTITYTYNAQGQLLSSTNIDGAITTYQYDEMGNLTLTQTTDNNTHETRAKANRYDAVGRLVAELSSKGQEALGKLLKANPDATQAQIEQIWQDYATTHLYDEAGRRIQTTDANGHAMRFFYDANGQLTASINALGEVKNYAHNAFGESTETRAYAKRLTDEQLTAINSTTSGLISQSITDILANLASDKDSIQAFQYNNRGQLEVKTDAQHYTNRISYNVFGEITSQTQQISADKETTTEFHYDAAGQLVETIYDKYNLKIKTSTKYDAFGRVTEQTDGNGNTTSFTYDKLGRQLTATNAKQITTSSTYDAFGNVLTITDGRKNTTTYTYDAKTNSMIMTTAGGFSTRTTSNSFGDVVSVTDANNNAVSYQYDADGNLTDVTDALNHNTHYDYDNTGLKTKSIDANGNVTEYHYNAIDQVTSVIVDPEGLHIEKQYKYDSVGNTISESVVDYKNRRTTVTNYQYDHNNQLREVIKDPGDIKLSTRYDYDGQGNIISVTESDKNGIGRVTEYHFDNLGQRKASIVDPDGLNVIERFEYDKTGNLIEKIDANGNSINYIYNVLNEMVYVVDALGGVAESVYDEAGNVVQTIRYAKPITTNVYEEDALRTILKTHVNDENIVSRNFYNEENRLVLNIDAEGGVSEIQYDSLGRLKSEVSYSNALINHVSCDDIDDILGFLKKDAEKDRELHYIYDANGNVAVKLTQVDGDSYGAVSYKYDANGNVLSQVEHATTTSGSSNVSGLKKWDVQIDHDINRGKFTADERSRVTNYLYNNIGQLEYKVSADNVIQAYQYDANGLLIDARTYSERLPSDVQNKSHITFAFDDKYVEKMEYNSVVLVVWPKGRPNFEEKFNANLIDGKWVVEFDDFNLLSDDYDFELQYLFHSNVAMYLTGTFNTSNTGQTVEKAIFKYGQYDQDGNPIYLEKDCDALINNDLTEDYLGAINKTTSKSEYHAEKISYDLAGRVQVKTDGADNTEIFTYDSLGNQTSYTDKNGNTYQYDYDHNGRVIFEHSPLVGLASYTEKHSITTAYTYDAFGNVTSQTNAYGTEEASTTSYEYDKLGRQTIIRLPEVEVYNASSNRLELQTLTRENIYDNLGNLVAQKDSAGNYQYNVYDKNGNILYDVDANHHVTGYKYDYFGNVVKQTRYANALNFSAETLVLSLSDFDKLVSADNDRSIEFLYDKDNRLVEKREPQIDVYSSTSKITIPSSKIYRYEYNTFGDLVKTSQNRIADEGEIWDDTYYYYDKARNCTSVVNSQGYVDTFDFDSFGNLVKHAEYANPLEQGKWTTISHGMPKPSQDYLYPFSNNAQAGFDRIISFEYDEVNQLRREIRHNQSYASIKENGYFKWINTDITKHYDYDGNGNVVHSRTSLDDPYNGTTESLNDDTYQYYNALGQLVASVGAKTAAGRSLTEFSYDANGNQRLITNYKQGASLDIKSHYQLVGLDSDDQTVEMKYNALGQLIETMDAEKNKVSIDYFASGELARTAQAQTDHDGTEHTRTLLNEYDKVGNLIASSETLLDNRVAKRIHQYNAFGEMTASGFDAKWICNYKYDNAGNLVYSNENGQDHIFTYDLNGKIIASIINIKDAKLDSVNHFSDALNLEGAHLTLYKYDSSGNLINQSTVASNGEQATLTQVYDRWGNVISAIDVSGYQTDYWYSSNNQVIKEKKPETSAYGYLKEDADIGNTMNRDEHRIRPTSLYAYDALGNTLGYLDSRGVSNSGDIEGYDKVLSEAFSKNKYDAAGRLIVEYHADGGWTKYEYDNLGRLVLKTWAVDTLRSGTTTYVYDHNNNLTDQINPVTSMHYTYDEIGNRLTETNGMDETHKYKFDTQDNIIKIEMPDGQIETRKYSTRGYLESSVDANKTTTKMEYDDFGRVVKQTVTSKNSKGALVTDTYKFDYYTSGSLKSKIYNNINTKEYTYYDNGLVRSINDNSTHSRTEFIYNFANQLVNEHFEITEGDNKGVFQDADYTYDELGRVSTVHDKNAGYDIEYRYDENSNLRATIGSNGEKTDESWYDYDTANRILRHENWKQVGEEVLSYDLMGNRLTSHYADMTFNEYNEEGLLVKAQTGGYWYERKYDAAGRTVEIIDYRALEHQLIKYNKNGWVTKQSTYKITPYSKGERPTDLLHTMTVKSFDAVGNVLQYEFSVQPRNGSDGYVNTFTKAYSYIDGYKIVKESGNSSYFKRGSTDYTYDGWGNLSSVVDNADKSHNQHLTVNDKGEIIEKYVGKTKEGAKVEQYFYQDGKAIGQIVNGRINFDYNMTPISSSFPGQTPTAVIANEGDNLESIAERVWGDKSLWYLLADANGLSGRNDVHTGQIIRVPNHITNIHNNSDTFKPYDPGSILGDLTPTLPAPPQPKFSMWRIFIVAVVVSVATSALQSLQVFKSLGNFVGNVASNFGATPSIAAATSNFVTGAAIGASASTIGQMASIELGIQNNFSWSDLGKNSLSAGIANGVMAGLTEAYGATAPNGMKSLGTWQKIGGAMLSDSIYQGLELLASNGKHFNWGEFAATGVGTGMGDSIQSDNPVDKIVQSMGSGITAAGVAYAIDRDNGINMQSIITSSIAQGVGNGIVEGLSYSGHEAESKIVEAESKNNESQRDLNNGSSFILDNVSYADGRAATRGYAEAIYGEVATTSMTAKSKKRNIEMAAQAETFEMCVAPDGMAQEIKQGMTGQQLIDYYTRDFKQVSEHFSNIFNQLAYAESQLSMLKMSYMPDGTVVNKAFGGILPTESEYQQFLNLDVSSGLQPLSEYDKSYYNLQSNAQKALADLSPSDKKYAAYKLQHEYGASDATAWMVTNYDEPLARDLLNSIYPVGEWAVNHVKREGNKVTATLSENLSLTTGFDTKVTGVKLNTNAHDGNTKISLGSASANAEALSLRYKQNDIVIPIMGENYLHIKLDASVTIIDANAGIDFSPSVKGSGANNIINMPSINLVKPSGKLSVVLVDAYGRETTQWSVSSKGKGAKK